MAVRTQCNRVVWDVGPAAGEPTDVVDLQEGTTVRFVEGCWLAAQLATTVGALENPALDLRVATHDGGFAFVAWRSPNASRCMGKRVKGICLVV